MTEQNLTSRPAYRRIPQVRRTHHFRELIAALCVVLLACALLAPAGAPDILIILPVVGLLCVTFIAVRIAVTTRSGFRVLDPSLASISVRAPPE